ncbi:hypothetical protein PROVRETT_09260 [Providencia rettgeri DSM 1131]|nr:hypothetical protein PROVRETT_09260 [Providencia rettgeri DSM 1131]
MNNEFTHFNLSLASHLLPPLGKLNNRVDSVRDIIAVKGDKTH